MTNGLSPVSLKVFEIVSPFSLILSNQHANWKSRSKDFDVNALNYCIICFYILDSNLREKTVIVGRTFFLQ
jgi:hypothetical protein